MASSSSPSRSSSSALIALIVLFNGGADGLSLKPFDPSESALGFSGMIYGLVFAIFAFVGFESATTLGEEAHEPRRTIPRAVLVTTLAVGAFYVLLIYSGVIGFGLTAGGLEALQSDGTPFDTLARSFSGSWLSTLSTIAVMTSFMALNIVTVTAASRMSSRWAATACCRPVSTTSTPAAPRPGGARGRWLRPRRHPDLRLDLLGREAMPPGGPTSRPSSSSPHMRCSVVGVVKYY